MSYKLLVVDDEPNITLSFSSLLKDEGYDVRTTGSAEKATDILKFNNFDLILLDIGLPGQSGIEFLRAVKSKSWPPEVLMISGQADIPSALEAVRLGAIDFLEKPVPPEKLITSVRSALALVAANRQRFLSVERIDEENRIIGNSSVIKNTLATIDQVAQTDTTVLITGENGTGKELAATRLYLSSNRREKPYIKVNCPGIPETLFESELFGHMKGSFTGAVKDYPGKFALADRGTIFLDEIGDLPLACQAKLLRVLESGEIETIGADSPRNIDVRVICATNRNLQKLISEGKFREDLFYRISVFEVKLPSLSEHTDDIPLLVGEFLRRYDPSGQTNFSADALSVLRDIPWSGNIRQLKNMVERFCILYQNRTISASDVRTAVNPAVAPNSLIDEDIPLSQRLKQYERSVIAEVLKLCDNNISETARRLGTDRAALSRRVKEFGLLDN